MPLQFYNTLTRREQPFEPLNPPVVTFYTCGPTVYDYAHIGNFRSFLAADVLRRYLDYKGYSVRHVMNITDVGHMVDDSVADGAGEDKMQAAQRRLKDAKKSGKLPDGAAAALNPDDPLAVADYFAGAFIEDAKTLGMKVVAEADAHPELLPRPTQYVQQMIVLVQRLIDNGHAYVAADGVVYFAVEAFPEYGRLSGNTLDQIRSGAGGRVDEHTQGNKKHPADFMLWKPDPTHLMRWPSPWGEGYPGWHLECSVMAASLLGTETNGVIDIHSGGEDNIFPHHECELAQSCGSTGEDHFARYWFHPRHLFVEGEKMSKSKNNFFTVRDILAKGYEPAAVRLELIKTHYRANANFTMQGLKDSQRMAARWKQFIESGEQNEGAAEADDSDRFDVVRTAFESALDNDLSVAGAIGVVSKWISETPTPTRAHADLMRRFDQVFGVAELAFATDACGPTAAATGDLDVARIEQLIVERTEARQSKDFARADAIRDELDAMGIELKDAAGETAWSRKLG
ncbi:MAG: cysteine--tRNA ligase [Planctomycetes bacterium]|nr:cysteine--tRNA ligase [Planctomycetota bacterium]NOG54744.1 cysteine--tRNA ligase [Planctomycetota bacterium]